MNRSARGVILVHVMVLLTLLAWLASMFLSSVLSRQIVAKQTMKSSDIRATMNAASARITSCLAGVPGPPPPPLVAAFPTGTNCAGSMTPQLLLHLQACLGGTSATQFTVGDAPNTRIVVWALCNTPTAPPCRFRINVCDPSDATCSAPDPACP